MYHRRQLFHKEAVMKKLFALSLIVMTAMLGGCLTSEDSKDDENGDTVNGGSCKAYGYGKLTDVNGAGR